MRAEKFSLRMELVTVNDVGPDGQPRTREEWRYNVVAVETAELPDGGADAVVLMRSDLERPQMHNLLLAACNDAFVRTWPPTDPSGGDKAHLRA